MQSAHAVLFCHLCPAELYSILPHYLINGTVFGKKSPKKYVGFDFLYNICVKHFGF